MDAGPSAAAVLGQAMDVARPVIDKACGLIETMLGEPCKVAGSMLSDQVYWWQWKNRLRIARRAAEILEHEKLATEVVPPDFLVPVLDAVGEVEDESLSEMWARLLVSGMHDEAHRQAMHIEILRKMSGRDAILFQRIASGDFNAHQEYLPQMPRAILSDEERAEAVPGTESADRLIALQLVRLIDPEIERSAAATTLRRIDSWQALRDHFVRAEERGRTRSQTFRLTAYGHQFKTAVTAPAT